jgi:hypothetical protein
MVVHVYNPTYCVAETEGSQFEVSLGKKVNKTLSQRTNRAWWHIHVIPAVREVELGGSYSKTHFK